MDKTKIEWCDMSWNPVTGCLHECPYCYARRMAKRFGTPYSGTDLHVIKSRTPKSYDEFVRSGPYPYEFAPTLRLDRLGEPTRKTKGRTIFVCSMADLFGNWVPEEWILKVFNACKAAPQHRYMFLTKNPKRYSELDKMALLPREKNFWYGTTLTNKEGTAKEGYDLFCLKLNTAFGRSKRWMTGPGVNTFLSIEPLLDDITESNIFGVPNSRISPHHEWVIIGAETGQRKGKVVPERQWIERIVESARTYGIPVFMKDSLKPIWGEDIITEYPWDKNF